MKSNHFLISMWAVCSLIIISSCHKPIPEPIPEPVPEPVPVEVSVGAYILNNGNWGSNDACMTFYDYITKDITPNAFLSTNGKKLGDTAQDMIVFGSKMYISVYNSKMIFVTDRSGKIIHEITTPGENGNLSPRYFTTYQDKVYVTYYEGFLAEIDTTSYSVRKVAVGPNPDQVAVASGKLYVANSGGLNYAEGYNNTVSVVDVATMTLSKTLQVVTNPQYIKANPDGYLYLISSGNYADIPCTLQKIDSRTDAVSTISGIAPSLMAMASGDYNLYMICSSYDAEWKLTCKYYVMDTKTDQWKEFITDGTDVQKAYSISVDNKEGYLYIGTSDYISNGDMYIFTLDGVFYKKFDVGGLNPIGVFPITVII